MFEVSVANGFRVYHALGGDMIKSLEFPDPGECAQQ